MMNNRDRYEETLRKILALIGDASQKRLSQLDLLHTVRNIKHLSEEALREVDTN